MPLTRTLFLSVSCLIFQLVGFTTVFAQREKILNLKDNLDSLRRQVPYEKVYLHLDKPTYLLDDSIYYKVYVLDGILPYPSQTSGIVYTELYNPEGQLVSRVRQHLALGSTFGTLALPETDREAGIYTLRAYTQWMQNFGPEFYYERKIPIEGDFRQEWTARVQPIPVEEQENKRVFRLQIALELMDGKRFPVVPVELSFHDKNGRELLRQREVTSSSGTLDIAAALPQKQNLNEVEVRLAQEGALKLQFPLAAHIRTKDVDIQMLPEGGKWIHGRPVTLGIKAIGPDGMGVPFQGFIHSEQGDTIASFHSLHAGMSTVHLQPIDQRNYQASFRFEDGSEKTVTLPRQTPQGISLSCPSGVSITTSKSHLMLLLADSATARLEPSLLLLIRHRGMLVYGSVISLKSEEQVLPLDPSTMPEGLLRITVADAEGKPLSERLIFNRSPDEGMKIKLETDKAVYSTRDSVGLKLTLRDSLNQPLKGNFSFTVTDDSLVRNDPAMENLFTYYNLQSELKGTLEKPGFYFSDDATAGEALNSLLLTQGWVRYDESWLEKKAAFNYEAEPFFKMAGKVSNAFGRPSKGVQVVAFGVGQQTVLLDTLTNDDGSFFFDELPLFDTLGFIVQARNRRGKSFNVGVEMKDDFKAAVNELTPMPFRNNGYVNPDTSLARIIREQKTFIANKRALLEGLDPNTILLGEAVVTAKKSVKNSKNLNGPGESDQMLDEADLLQQSPKNLLQVLYEKIDGFSQGIYPRKQGRPEFMVYEKKARLIVDGIDLEFFYEPPAPEMQQQLMNDHLNFIRGYLEYYSAEDLLGVEIMYNPRYNGSYNQRYLNGMELMNISPVMGTDPVYIEITTRGGQGPFMSKTPGVTHFRPFPFTWPKDFYRPKYPTKEALPLGTDLRSTIHWEPMLLIGAEGEAEVSFFTSDRRGAYTIRMEGIDFEGNIGIFEGKIKVE